MNMQATKNQSDQSDQSGQSPDRTIKAAKELKEKLVGYRREIHSHPELSFQENATAKLAAAAMSKLGYDVRPGVGGTGVVAELGSGRTVIVRADMDALPIQEKNETDYASKNPGVMHACGHDVHVSCALGAAELLAKNPPAQGKVRFIFQPAEEMVNDDGKSGAVLMIEQGVTDGAECVVALHVYPHLPAGQIAVKTGPMLAACDSFDITLRGTASHGAHPEQGIDAIVLASHVVQSVQNIISRRKSALEPAVITLGGIKSATFRPNIVADQVHLTGTARYFDKALGKLICEELHRACRIAEALGGSYEMKYVHDNPAVVNDPQITNIVRLVATKLLGKENVHESTLEMGAEDFSFMTEALPGCFFFLGTGVEGKPPCMLHSPTFDVNEDAIPLGAALLAESVYQFLGQSS